MKKISTAAAQEIEKVEGQKLTIAGSGKPIELVLRSECRRSETVRRGTKALVLE